MLKNFSCVVFFLLAFYCLPLQAQDGNTKLLKWVNKDAQQAAKLADSLLRKNPAENKDTMLGRALYLLSSHFTQQSDLGSAEKYATPAYNILKGQHSLWQVKSQIKLGYIFSRIGKYDSAQYLLSTAIQDIDKHYPEQQLLKIDAMSSLGICYAQKIEYKKAFAFFTKADSLSLAIDNQAWHNTLINYLGNLSVMMDNYNDALYYFKKSKEKYLETGDTFGLLAIYNNMSNCYTQLGEYDKALEELKTGRIFAEQVPDSFTLKKNYTNTASIYIKQGELDKAENALDKAYTYLKNNSPTRHVQEINVQKMKLYEYQENWSGLKELASEHLRLTQQSKELSSQMFAHELLAFAYENMMNFEKALFHERAKSSLTDSINSVNYNEQLAEMQAKYKSLQQKQEIAQLATKEKLAQEQATLEAQKNKLLWTIIAIVIAGIFVLSFMFLRQRRAQKALSDKSSRLAKSDKEKGLLLKELHHRVKNNLQIVSSLLNLQMDSVEDDMARAAFKEGQNRVDAMAMIHRHLYSGEELTHVDIKAYLERLIRSLAYSYGYSKHNFQFEDQITEKAVDVDIAIPVGLVVNELASNAFKHAFGKQKKASIRLYLEIKDELLHLEFSDNGTGLPGYFSLENQTSFGLELVQTMVQQLKGTIEFKSDNGAHFYITFQKSKSLAA